MRFVEESFKPSESGAEAAAPRIPVILGDRNALVRQGIRELLESQGFAVVAETADGAEAVRLAQVLRPRVVVLDALLAGLNGMEAGRAIRATAPGSGVVLTGSHGEPPYVFEALRSGIDGYVRRQQVAAGLPQAIRDVARGDPHLSAEVAGPVVRKWLVEGESPWLLRRETEWRVARLMADGMTIEAMISALGLTREDLESLRAAVLRALARSLRS